MLSVADFYNRNTGAWFLNQETGDKFYNWYAIAGIHDNESYNEWISSGVEEIGENSLRKHFAPEGWHVPHTDEWFDLFELLDSYGYSYPTNITQYGLAKAMASTNLWRVSTVAYTPGNFPETNNTSGFNALPISIYGGVPGSSGSFWCIDGGDMHSSYAWTFSYHYVQVQGNILENNLGLQVRLVKD